MIDYKDFLLSSKDSNLALLDDVIEGYIESGLSTSRYGDLSGWLEALAALPEVETTSIDLLNTVQIGTHSDCSKEEFAQLKSCFEDLIPWRKGPFSLFDLHIDTEWRSDWKWDRLKDKISPLKNRTVLDVGCGNGYHCLRMFGEQASRVVGIDPSPRFVVQFHMIKKYLGSIPVDVLPAALESLPDKMEAFDTTFSMGVLYHRRSPFDHLYQLKDTLKPGGELVLETLVIDGSLGQTLVSEGRYAKMNNVWFLPSVPTLESWLKKCGFKDIEVIDQNTTSLEEQRSTQWMKYQSLRDFLDEKDPSLTAEGHPAPQRAILRAQKPT